MLYFFCSVLLSILAPHVALPPGIDQLKCVKEKSKAAEGNLADSQIAITFGTTDEGSGTSLTLNAFIYACSKRV